MFELICKYFEIRFEKNKKGALSNPGPNDCLGTGLLSSLMCASVKFPFN